MQYRLVLGGDGVSLRETPAREWVEVLSSCLKALEVGAPDAVVIMPDLQAGSVACPLETVDGDVGPAWDAIADAVAQRRPEGLWSAALDFVDAAAKFARRHPGRHVEMRGREVVRIDASFDVEVHRPIRGASVLFGRLLRIGGQEPRVALRLGDGRLVTGNATEEVARRIASMLYQDVGLRATVSWDPRTWEVVTFQAMGFAEPDSLDVTAGLAAAALVEDSWGNDPVRAIAEFRGDGGE